MSPGLTDDAIALIVGAVLALAGVVLGVVCLWWRRGRSRSARWWVRPIPVQQMARFPPFEGLALVHGPVFAETLVALGALIALGPMLSRNLSWSLWPLAGAATLQFALLIAAWAVAAYRWVLPIWIYPPWLREQRRADAAWLRRERPDGYAGR